MSDKKTHGGKRPGAGRKRSEDPKRTISLYVRQSIIDLQGGERYLKEKCYQAIGQAHE